MSSGCGSSSVQSTIQAIPSIRDKYIKSNNTPAAVASKYYFGMNVLPFQYFQDQPKQMIESYGIAPDRSKSIKVNPRVINRYKQEQEMVKEKMTNVNKQQIITKKTLRNSLKTGRYIPYKKSGGLITTDTGYRIKNDFQTVRF